MHLENLRGIALMVTAMVFFATTDMFVKFAAHDLPVGQVMALLGAGGASIFALLTRARGHAVFARDFFRGPMILRNACEMSGTVCFITALSKIEISTASAILQATPLAVTLGAVVVLREPVGWRRWSAILVGFAGVLIILRPGLSGFQSDALWAVAGMLFLGLRDLLTRLIPAGTPTLRIATYGMGMLVPAGLVLLLLGDGTVAMRAANWGQITGAVLFGVAGYYAITSAMRLGEISVIAPFRYSRIIFALTIGFLAFGERPDLWTLTGCGVTIAAGLYTFLRERRLRDPLTD